MERSQLEENILLCLLFGPKSIGDPVSPECLHYLKVRWSKNNLSLCIKVEPLTADAWCLYEYIWFLGLRYVSNCLTETVAFAPAATGSTFLPRGQIYFGRVYVQHPRSTTQWSPIQVQTVAQVALVFWRELAFPTCLEITYCPVQLLIILQHCHAGERRGDSTVLSMVV